MKVLVLGAGGFIGLPIAQGFVRNGHEVYGSTRSASCIVEDHTSRWARMGGHSSQDGSHCRLYNCWTRGGQGVLGDDSWSEQDKGSYKITYVYSSGTWVHGTYEQREKGYTDERAPLKQSAEIVAWRPAIEQSILAHPDVTGIVIRPPLLYGRTMSLLELLFEAALAGKIE